MIDLVIVWPHLNCSWKYVRAVNLIAIHLNINAHFILIKLCLVIKHLAKCLTVTVELLKCVTTFAFLFFFSWCIHVCKSTRSHHITKNEEHLWNIRVNNDKPLGLQGSYERQQEVLLCQQLAEQGERLLNIGRDLEMLGVVDRVKGLLHERSLQIMRSEVCESNSGEAKAQASGCSDSKTF